MRYPTIIGLLAFCTLPAGAEAQVPEACQTLRFAPGQYTEVPSQHDEMYLVSINERGDILGHWSQNDPSRFEGFYSEAFVIRHGEYIPIAVPRAFHTFAVDMNAKGIVIGNFRDADYQLRGFRWESGEFTILTIPDPDAIATFVEGLNAGGTIVGRAYLPNGGLRGYVYRAGSYDIVDDPPGWAGHSYARDVDNSGDLLIVGVDQTASAYYLKTRDGIQPIPLCPSETAISFADGGGLLGGMRLAGHDYGSLRSDQLVTIYHFPGAQATYLWDVNARGDAVGVAYDADWTTRHVFIYSPRRD